MVAVEQKFFHEQPLVQDPVADLVRERRAHPARACPRGILKQTDVDLDPFKPIVGEGCAPHDIPTQRLVVLRKSPFPVAEFFDRDGTGCRRKQTAGDELLHRNTGDPLVWNKLVPQKWSCVPIAHLVCPLWFLQHVQ